MATTRSAKGAPAKMGRPSTYTPEHAALAFKLCLLGATDREIADCLGRTERTVNEWKHLHPDFGEALKRGKILADAEVAAKLFQRACGYSHPAVKIYRGDDGGVIEVPYEVHYPPDTQAASLWLRNRRPALWRDKQEIDLGKDDDSLLSGYTEEQLIERLMQRRNKRRSDEVKGTVERVTAHRKPN